MTLKSWRPADHTLDKFGGPEEPWLTRESVTFLNGFLTKEMICAEFGCGSSTKWIADRVKKLISIENDEAWHNNVKKHLEESGVTNVDSRFYNTTKCSLEYIGALHDVENQSLDFIIVDGRFRVKCVKENYKKLKVGGLFVIDNTCRNYYKEGVDFLTNMGWKRFDSNNGIIITSRWIRI